MAEMEMLEPELEPAGIVISRGTEEVSLPRFIAYVWGQAEDDVPTEPQEVLAA